jgi:hypothetical protein
LERAVKLSGGRISAQMLRQGLEVDVAQAPDVLSTKVVVIIIRAVDSTAEGAAQLANAVLLASRQVMAEQQDAGSNNSTPSGHSDDGRFRTSSAPASISLPPIPGTAGCRPTVRPAFRSSMT